jgi:DNA-binding transcriptional LysR family regulator
MASKDLPVEMGDGEQASSRSPGGHRTITAAKVEPMTWNSLDLNLLRVFNAIMQERTLTRAGQKLGMSQPAMSHALARLRHMLKDDVFVRSPDGMCPTPRAERMEGPLRAALQELRITLEDDEFDAAQASRNFVIVANNHAARAVVPVLSTSGGDLLPSAP